MHTIAVAVLLAGTASGLDEPYDVVLRGGRVFVGDGTDAVHTDVALRGDQIVRIGACGDMPARRVIDVSGLVVSPGFINMLSWSTESLIGDGRSFGEMRQGVTTQVFGEGQSMGPLNAAMKRRRKAQQTFVKFDYEWDTLAGYLEWLARRGVAQNVASFVGAGTVREYVMGLANRRATAAELEQMSQLVAQEMERGAIGVGSALVYPPGSYASTDELIALCRAAAPYGGLYASHVRNQGDEVVEAVDELIRISRESGIAAEMYHLGVAGEANWGKLDEVIARFEHARAGGLPVSANMHTYRAGCTGLTACLPPWVLEGGDLAARRRLRDPLVRRRIAREIGGDGKGWDNPYRIAGTPDNIVPVHFENTKFKPFEGRSLAEIAAERGQDPIETLIDLIAEDGSRIETVYYVDCEENVRRMVLVPWITFGSDAASISTESKFQEYGTHPRAFGNFARVLGKYVREEGLVSLAEAIHRLSGLPASRLGLERRGLLREGYFADVVAFDPDAIADRATFERPMQYAEGVKHVFVNGVQVLDDGRHTGALPGRAVFRGRRDSAVRASESWGLVETPPRPPFGRGGQGGSHSLIRGSHSHLTAFPSPSTVALTAIASATLQSDESFRAAREQMVRESLEKAEPPIKNPRVLESMRTTPRHLFVAPQYRRHAYVDTILPIGHQQTISPPFIVAYMTEMLDPQRGDRVLEIGTGSGYQAAVLSPLVDAVYTIEIVEPLGRKAAEVLKRLGYSNVSVRVGDGYQGWPEHAPFDKIIVTCSPDHVPQPLVDQLKEGGSMIIPVGERYQQSFYRVQKRDGKLTQERLLGTFFVPMTGEAERQRRDNPDGTKPAVTNGDFESGADPSGAPDFWYYHRGVTLEDEGAPQGKHFAAYTNDDPGHLTHSNQGIAVDGRRVESLQLSFWVKTERSRVGPRPEHIPGIAVNFIDSTKKIVDTRRAGPFEGSMDWREQLEHIAVPRTAEYAVIMIGLNGGTGRIAFDDIRITPVPRGRH